MNSTPVFKETITKTHAKKIAAKGYVFLVATAEVGTKIHTASLEVLETITGEERRILFSQMWNDLKPRVQKTVSKEPKPVKEHCANTKKIIAYALIGVIILIILLCALL